MNEVQIPSQVLLKKTISNKNKALSIATKVAIQMSVKVGNAVWEIERNHKFFKDRIVLSGGLSISKNKKHYTLGFVGTINTKSTEIFSRFKGNIKEKEKIGKQVFFDIYYEWLNNFMKQKNEPTLPHMIMIYREGLSDSQLQIQLHPEIEALNDAVEKIREEKKLVRRPSIVYMTVNKKIDTRFFARFK